MNPEFWNRKFNTHKKALYGVQPNRYFQSQLDQLNPGTLLVPACGQGRDALYAAEKGHRVIAAD